MDMAVSGTLQSLSFPLALYLTSNPPSCTTKAELYNALYRYLLTRDDVLELTIEDPAEAFEDLRDKNDLQMLLADETFTREGSGSTGSSPSSASSPISRGGKLGPPADKVWAEKWRVKLKIAKVSFFSSH